MEIADDTASLVEQAKNGSHSAFTELVRMNQANIRTYLSRFLRGEESADDLAQEVFLAAFRQLEDYRGTAPFGAWLMGIARNQALVFMRSEMRRRRRAEQVAQAALADWQFARLNDSGASDDDHEATLAALRSCIDRLVGHNKSFFGSHPGTNILSDKAQHLGNLRKTVRRN